MFCAKRISKSVLFSFHPNLINDLDLKIRGTVNFAHRNIAIKGTIKGAIYYKDLNFWVQ